MTISNSLMRDCEISSPQALGLTVNACWVYTSKFSASQTDGLNEVPSFNRSRFVDCELSQPEVVMASNACEFQKCRCEGLTDTTLGKYLPKPVLVKIAWENGTPAKLPTSAGSVHFEPIPPITMLGENIHSGWMASSEGKFPDEKSRFHLFSAINLTREGGPPPVSISVPVANTRTNNIRTNAAPGVITFASMTPGMSFKSRITQVNGLLISQLASGGEAGQVTRMSLTALPTQDDSNSTLKFNQDVGDSMGKALNEVSKFSQLRHNGWPAGHQLEIGFEDKYVGKDGPSAAVACALLLEAAVTGKKWDLTFAVTGDMNSDGSVQPIGGVQAKIRGATKGSCKLVGVPVKNEKSVADILVTDGPAPLVGITIFGIKTFEDALLLASTERPQALQNALTDFDNMRTVMMRDPRQIVPLLRTPQAAQRLQALLNVAPNCYSAKYLLLHLQGRAPKVLSIGGSIEAAQGSAQSIVSAIDHDVDTNMSNLKGDELGTSLNKLRRLRPLLDQRVWPYADNLVSFGEVIRGSVLNPVRSGARYLDLVSKANQAAGAAKAAYEKLLGDVQVREELGL